MAPLRAYRIERVRGTEEARQQLAELREKWPLAFPVKDQDVRPLAIGATGEIAAAMRWSLPYTLGVLGRWKMAPVYCQAVLCHDQRIALDGTPAETVDAGQPRRYKGAHRHGRPPFDLVEAESEPVAGFMRPGQGI